MLSHDRKSLIAYAAIATIGIALLAALGIALLALHQFHVLEASLDNYKSTTLQSEFNRLEHITSSHHARLESLERSQLSHSGEIYRLKDQISHAIDLSRKKVFDRSFAVVWRPQILESKSSTLRGGIHVSTDEITSAWFEIKSKSTTKTVPANLHASAANFYSATADVPSRFLEDNQKIRLAAETTVGIETSSWLKINIKAPSALFSVTTAGAELETRSSIVMNGISITPGLRGRSWFEYGYSSTHLDSRTKPMPLPGPRNACYRSDLSDQSGLWLATTPTHFHSEEGGFLRVDLGNGSWVDPNHVLGIGYLNLIGQIQINALEATPIDFRDALLRFRLRGINFDPRKSELVPWVQTELSLPQRSIRPNYALTAWPLSEYLLDHSWHTAEVTFLDDSRYWSFGGFTRENSTHYAYAPISDVLRNLNLNVILVSAFGEPDGFPVGQIDIGNIEFCYRNNSALAAANGARWVAVGARSENDPALLTDGNQSLDTEWFTVDRHATFEWKLGYPATIERIVLHGDADHAPTMIEVWSSTDGKAYHIIGHGSPKHGRNSSLSWLETKGTNVAFLRLVVRGNSPLAFSEIEALGDVVPIPDAVPATSSAVVQHLKTGQTLYYRYVVESQGHIASGALQSISVPLVVNPTIVYASAVRYSQNRAVAIIRVNLPKGGKAVLDYRPKGSNEAPRQVTAVTSDIDYPRTVFFPLSDLKDDRPYELTYKVRDAHGTVASKEIELAAHPLPITPEARVPH
jgi:hypothetical protein